MGLGGARRLLLCALVCAAVGTLVTACTPRTQQDIAGDPTARATAGPASEAGDLRLTLEQAFGLRAHLLVADAASSDLRRNAVSIAEAIAAGDNAGDMDTALATHADAIGEGEAGDASAALASALSDTIGSAADAETTAELVEAATRSLVDARGAAAQNQHDEALAAARDAFAEMVDVGRAFAAGVSQAAPQDYPGPRSTGLLELRSALRQLLGEHALLMVSVTRSGATGARNFEASAAALNGNTEDLIRALRSTYGTQVDGFDRLWRGRISDMAEYTVAAARDDQDATKHLREQVRGGDGEVAGALAALTDEAMDRKEAAAALRRMSAAMLAQVDEWVAERPAPAGREQLRAYERSAVVADLLAAAIAADRPEEFADDR